MNVPFKGLIACLHEAAPAKSGLPDFRQEDRLRQTCQDIGTCFASTATNERLTTGSPDWSNGIRKSCDGGRFKEASKVLANSYYCHKLDAYHMADC